jgi:tRNA modification GTPase
VRVPLTSANLRIRELTPRGRGGVTVLELRGENALEKLASLAPSLLGKSPKALQNTVLVRLRETTRGGDEDLDEALIWKRSDDCFELHLHGSPVLVRRVCELLGASADSPGEDRLLSIEQRAARALESAPSDAAARLLLDQSRGALRVVLEELATCGEAERSKRLASLAGAGRIARFLIDVPRVVLAGPVNAGKSTLFNLLVGHERVVVSGEEGTTRDAVRSRARLGAYAVDLVDTAGARDASGRAEAVEREGQAQGLGEAALADVIFWLSPTGRGEASLENLPGENLPGRAAIVRFATKSDTAFGAGPGDTDPGLQAISTHEDPVGTREIVESAFRAALELPEAPWLAGSPAPFDELGCRGIADLQAAADEPTFQKILSRLLAAQQK